MSTNFYHRYNRCEHCDRYEERHIGKSSGGWQFSFRAYYDDGNVIIGSYNDWKEVLKLGDIFDEYGTWYSYDQFIKRVESSKGKQNHYDYIKNAPQYQEYGMKHLEGNYKDDDGWDFSKGEFS
jgi:hypothetical protein